MTKIIFSTVFVLSTILVFYLAPANASTYSQTAEFSVDLPVLLNEGNQLAGYVDFGVKFFSIENISVYASLIDDYWDNNENITIFIPGKNGSIGVSFYQSFPFPLTEITWENSDWDYLIAALTDGGTDFYFEVNQGSFGIQQVTFEVTGSAVPLPSTLFLLLPGIVGVVGARIFKSKQERKGQLKCL